MSAADDIWYRVEFHPVGQGLFISGALCRYRRHRSMLRWIYDCGTTSSLDLVTNAIDTLSWSWPFPAFTERDHGVELVTVSHFDRDHISGLERLIQKRRIGTLLLPYAPLWSRLAAQFELEMAPEDSAFAAIIDPVGYLRGAEGGDRIGRILFVPPSGGERPPEPGPPDVRDEPGGDPDADEGADFAVAPQLSADTEPLTAEQATELMLDPEAQANADVAMLRPATRLLVDDFWEWVPYNDAELRPTGFESFAIEVERLRSQLLAAGARLRAGTALPSTVTNALTKLKAYYDSAIGKDSKKRNLISLFLYGGPTELGPWKYIYETRPGFEYRRFSTLPGQLFSGDGYLDSAERVDALESYLGRRRLSHLGVFQVMHHGARANWHPGVAAKLAPEISVFSSDPEHKSFGHPHAEVLRDFWAHGAVQVDKDHGVLIERRPY
jgi:hypothetical protein